jgi:hypothetical protein
VACLSQPSHDELGRAIEQALARSQEGVPTPPPDARIDKPLLAAAGVRSWTTFMKLSKHVSVVSDGSLLKVTPYRNLGSKEGFEPEPDIAVPSANSASALGRSLQTCSAERHSGIGSNFLLPSKSDSGLA